LVGGRVILMNFFYFHLIYAYSACKVSLVFIEKFINKYTLLPTYENN